jgi:hypothetical protein
VHDRALLVGVKLRNAEMCGLLLLCMVGAGLVPALGARGEGETGIPIAGGWGMTHQYLKCVMLTGNHTAQ